MSSLGHDLRHAFRLMVRDPGFTIVALAAMALGIGAVTTTFSMIQAYFLRPLPFTEPDRLVHVWSTSRSHGWTMLRVSVPTYLDWRRENAAFDDLAAFNYTEETLTGGERPEQIPAGRVSANTFDLLGIAPVVGRSFHPGEDQPGAAPVAVISHAFWKRRFAFNRDVVGRMLEIDDVRYTIVGVMPPDFVFPLPTTELWIPRVLDVQKYPRDRALLQVIGRLRPGVTLAAARAGMEGLAARLGRAYPEDLDRSVNVVPLREALNFAYDILRISFGVVLAGNMFVLLIVCANISSLLWARSLTRVREVAIRSALGASRWRLMRQLLVESTVLAALGGAAGILLAAWAAGVLRATMPDDLYRVGAVSLDGAALAVTLVVSFATALAFGLAPAWRLTRADLAQSIKDGTATAFGRSSVQAVLVAGQIALSVMLLVGTGLMLRSFQALRQVNPGFTADRVLSLKLALPSSRYAGREAAAKFHRNLLEEAKAVPGVTRAATVNFLPLNHEQAEQEFAVIGQEQASSGKQPTAVILSVSAGYFEAMSIPVTRGRPFSERDDLSAPPVVVINRTMANQYWRDTDPIGRRLIIGGQVEPYAVVGVVGDTNQSNLTEPPGPQMYVSQLQRPSTYFRLIARTLGEPRAIAKGLQGAVWRVDRDLPVTEIRPLTEVVSEYLLPQRTVSASLAFMGVGALLLAVIGIYGLMAFFVARRRKEIAIRMALGARRADILGLVLRRGLTLAAAGVIVGLAGSVGVVQAMKSLIFGVGTLDPVAFGGIPLALIGVASLASWLPARRASRVDPMAALRQE